MTKVRAASLSPDPEIRHLLEQKNFKSDYGHEFPVTFAEGFMALLFASSVVVGIATHNTAFVLFHSMLAMGFGTICYFSIKHLHAR